ncbi:MAG: rRNA maturation RNase YbeY [Cyclobacteriaceae bacterium]|jgi:rRNA maturation RNase YbeY|nr:rRNA maturation RNase YbeY [Cyclobacteriaceae bacterium]
MGKIRFFSDEIPFSVPKPRKTQSWITNVVTREGKSVTSINFIFCSDSYLADINQRYLKHNTLTDIITFDYSEPETIAGDIYISVERVSENAEKFGQPFETELYRVMIHGVLHLLGYKDKTPQQKQQMRRKEDTCLSLYS